MQRKKKLVSPVDDTDVSLLSVDLNVTSDDTKDTSDYTQDILRRETYKRNSRMRFLSLRNWYRIIKTRHTLLQANYKELKTHIVLFSGRFHRSQLAAKIKLPHQLAQRVESRGFWPDVILCRRLHSFHEWENGLQNRSDNERYHRQPERWQE